MPCYICDVSWRKNDRPIGVSLLLDMKTGGYNFIFYLTELTEIFMLFYYPIAEGDEGEACDEAEEDVGDESADIAVLEHL